MTAFALSRAKQYFPQRNIYMWFLVFNMLFHGGLVPTYMLISELKLIDTLWVLVLPGAVPIFSIIILMNYMRNLPDELFESARIDGAGPWTIMVRIAIPLAVPSIATITLFSVVGHWNAWFDGAIYINSLSKVPLQTYIRSFITIIQDTSNLSPEELERWNEISGKTFNAAKIFVSMLPVMIIYPFLQKFFVTGLVLGSVKG
jgi:ABC-type glycerol-3-phosphate transport system permease component